MGGRSRSLPAGKGLDQLHVGSSMHRDTGMEWLEHGWEHGWVWNVDGMVRNMDEVVGNADPSPFPGRQERLEYPHLNAAALPWPRALQGEESSDSTLPNHSQNSLHLGDFPTRLHTQFQLSMP